MTCTEELLHLEKIPLFMKNFYRSVSVEEFETMATQAMRTFLTESEQYFNNIKEGVLEFCDKIVAEVTHLESIDHSTGSSLPSEGLRSSTPMSKLIQMHKEHRLELLGRAMKEEHNQPVLIRLVNYLVIQFLANLVTKEASMFLHLVHNPSKEMQNNGIFSVSVNFKLDSHQNCEIAYSPSHNELTASIYKIFYSIARCMDVTANLMQILKNIGHYVPPNRISISNIIINRQDFQQHLRALDYIVEQAFSDVVVFGECFQEYIHMGTYILSFNLDRFNQGKKDTKGYLENDIESLIQEYGSVNSWGSHISQVCYCILLIYSNCPFTYLNKSCLISN
jgi:hypothetical protein